MATRTHAREAVMGLLYGYAIGNDAIGLSAQAILEEKKIKNKQQDFALKLFAGVQENLEALDKIIEENLDDWEFKKLGNTEKSILRLGTYELLYTDTDAPIIINEAVELAKSYGEDNAPKLINGVLDAIRKTKGKAQIRQNIN